MKIFPFYLSEREVKVSEKKNVYDDAYILKKLLTDQSGLFINQIKEIMENISFEEFNKFSRDLLQNNDLEILKTLNYYLFLFKKIPSVQRLMNHEDTPLGLLECLIKFDYENVMSKKKLVDINNLDHAFYYLNQDKYLNLLVYSEKINTDHTLSYFILTLMDKTTIEKFFDKKENLKEFVLGFQLLSEDIARTLILRNPDLFSFLVMYLHIFDQSEIAEEITRKFEKDIVEMEKIKKIAIQSSLIEEESEATQSESKHKISSKRLQFLIAEFVRIKEKHDINKLLEKDEIFHSKQEQSLVREILLNPMYRDILRSLQQKMV